MDEWLITFIYIYSSFIIPLCQVNHHMSNNFSSFYEYILHYLEFKIWSSL